MAYITKRGNSYSVRYTYEDEHGKSCDKWESFPTKEEATNRKKQIEHELAAGTFLIPSSVTVADQLMISGGDVKAVQGTTGHATADMLVNTYAHIQQSSRVELGRKFEEGFYAKQESPSPQAVPAEGEPTISMTALLELLKNADPEVKAQLRLALLT